MLKLILLSTLLAVSGLAQAQSESKEMPKALAEYGRIRAGRESRERRSAAEAGENAEPRIRGERARHRARSDEGGENPYAKGRQAEIASSSGLAKKLYEQLLDHSPDNIYMGEIKQAIQALENPEITHDEVLLHRENWYVIRDKIRANADLM